MNARHLVCVSLLLAGCGNAAEEAPANARSVEATSPAAAEETPIEAPHEEVNAGVDAGVDAGEASSSAPPGEPQPTLELAIAPIPNAVVVLAQRRIGASLFVLFAQDVSDAIAAEPEAPAFDDVRLTEAVEDAVNHARFEDAAATLTQETRTRLLADEVALHAWAERVGTSDGACEDADSFGLWDCIAATSMSEAEALVRFEPSLRRIGVARVEGRAGRYQALAQQTLFAFATLTEGSTPHLLPSDLDGDGETELAATLELTLPRGDSGMGGLTQGRALFVFDTELHVQLALGTALDEADVDVAGSSVHCVTAVSYADTTQDAHAEVQLAQRCTTTFVDEERGADTRRRASETVSCPYDVAADRWDCPVQSNDIVRGAGSSLVGAAGLLQAPPGVDIEARLRSARQALGVEAPSDTRRCRVVVEDPAPPLRVRSRPSTHAEVVAELANGTVLELHERSGRFARIEAPASGWVWTANLREVCE